MQTILVIDDDPVLCRLIEHMLQGRGFTVFTVESAQKALSLVQTQRPDLILSDIDLGGMDGCELLKQVRHDRATADIPFVLMSGRAALTGFSIAMGRGADDFLAKPFSSEELLGRLNAVLQNRLGEAGGKSQPCSDDHGHGEL